MHAILWGSESCDCNKDEYDRRNALCLWNPKNHCFENMAPRLPQSCAAVSAAGGLCVASGPIYILLISPINPFRCMATVGYNATVLVYNRIRTVWEEMGILRSEGDMQCDACYCRWVRIYPPPGCLWRLWWSESTPTQPFHPDGNVFCWCYMVSLWNIWLSYLDLLPE